jgi:hypothetical protein
MVALAFEKLEAEAAKERQVRKANSVVADRPEQKSPPAAARAAVSVGASATSVKKAKKSQPRGLWAYL